MRSLKATINGQKLLNNCSQVNGVAGEYLTALGAIGLNEPRFLEICEIEAVLNPI